ncbi:MAG: pyridoxal phosphate-dependent aminotransferase [Eubacterium sp.]|nr:pyridoxal phosphate-dependent aminotransferase [Eubacterium sp.]
MNMHHDFDEPVIRRGTDCKKYKNYAEDVLPMWIADTDFKCPQPVIDACVSRMQQGVYGYPDVSEAFKEAIACWQEKRFGWKVDASACEFVPGVIPGVICAVRALSHPGDNIAMLTPTYPPFNDLSVHNGRNVLRCELKVRDGQYSVDFDDLEKKLSEERTRIFLLCNPHNPTGRVFTEEELRRMAELCLHYDVTILSDEIHSDIVYKGYRHIPIASLSPEYAEHCITFVNASKTFNVAGFRTAGFIATNPSLKRRVHEAVLDNKGIGENLCGTQATIAAYTQCDYYADELVEYLEGNLDILCEAISKTDKIDLIRPEGTYLIWLDCRKMNLPQKELKAFFENKAKLGLNDGETFGPEGIGFMRINIATQRDNVRTAVGRIEAALKELP